MTNCNTLQLIRIVIVNQSTETRKKKESSCLLSNRFCRVSLEPLSYKNIFTIACITLLDGART